DLLAPLPRLPTAQATVSAAHNDLSANGDPEPQLLTSAESAGQATPAITLRDSRVLTFVAIREQPTAPTHPSAEENDRSMRKTQRQIDGKARANPGQR